MPFSSWTSCFMMIFYAPVRCISGRLQNRTRSMWNCWGNPSPTILYAGKLCVHYKRLIGEAGNNDLMVRTLPSSLTAGWYGISHCVFIFLLIISLLSLSESHNFLQLRRQRFLSGHLAGLTDRIFSREGCSVRQVTRWGSTMTPEDGSWHLWAE